MPNKTDPYAYSLQRIDLFTEVDRETVPVTAIVREPFERLDESWLCAASISGLFHRKADLESTSAEAAVRAARSFIFAELAGYAAGGGQLLTAKGVPADLKAMVFKPV